MAKRRLLFLFFWMIVTVSPAICNSFEFKKSLQTGIHVGYSGTYIEDGNFPNVFNGAAFGLHAVLGLTESVGIAWDGTFDWHGNYRRYSKEEVTDDDGEMSMEWMPKSLVENYFVSTTGLSVLYAIDVTRLLPYLAAGPVGVRVDQTVDGVRSTTYGFGLRLGGGFDYCFKRFTVGAGILSDRYYVGNSDHERRILFMLRISALFRI